MQPMPGVLAEAINMGGRSRFGGETHRGTPVQCDRITAVKDGYDVTVGMYCRPIVLVPCRMVLRGFR